VGDRKTGRIGALEKHCCRARDHDGSGPDGDEAGHKLVVPSVAPAQPDEQHGTEKQHEAEVARPAHPDEDCPSARRIARRRSDSGFGVTDREGHGPVDRVRVGRDDPPGQHVAVRGQQVLQGHHDR
jgi:hypothetical protein